jgi:SpoVK/Ycf46/Vps4 family AAA+-type ATPase
LEQEHYKNSLDHILHELKWLDLQLANGVFKFRNRQGGQELNEYSGLYITDNEIDNALKPGTIDKCSTYPENLQAIIQETEESIKTRLESTLKFGINLSLIQLSKRFELSLFETRIILFCLAPEIDSKYERIYAYLHNDVTKRRPTMGLILDTFCNSIEEKARFRKYFMQSSKLFKFSLLKFKGLKDGDISWHMLSSPIHIDEHITSYILNNQDKLDWRIEPFATLLKPWENDERSLSNQFFIFNDLKKRILSIVKKRSQNSNITNLKSQKTILYFIAPNGTGKKTLAKEISRELGLPLMIADLSRSESYKADFEDMMALLFKELIIQNAILFIDNFNYIWKNETIIDSELEIRSSNSKLSTDYDMKLNILLRNIESSPQQIIILSGESELPLDRFGYRQYPITIKLPEFSYVTRKNLWSESLNDYDLDEDVNIDDLSTKFHFNAGQIKNALLDVNNAHLLKNGHDDNIRSHITSSELYEACRLQSSRRISSLAKRLDLDYTLEDIILPPDKKRQIVEILNIIKFKNQVFYDWGFEEKLSFGKGLNILFAGESGTGKTMTAAIIAKELNLDLYRIDLSSIVSKYVGQTEKNINKIFNEAKASNAIVFLDEADAICGKRSEVKQAQDRYANIEINFLLQKLEEHEEIVILASNLAKNIDDAFVRRMHCWIEFPSPDLESRLRIWKNMFPEKAPLDTNTVDFNFLAKQFQITGGIIKNIAISSAFLAKESGSNKITMDHIIKASKREFDKMGKPCLKTEFGKYYKIISSEN